MTNAQKAAKVRNAAKAYYNSHRKAENKLLDLKECMESVTGVEVQFNHFPGDGLGVVSGDSSVHTYMSISDAISIIKEKGTLDGTEFTYL